MKILDQMRKLNKRSTFTIQITSMVDMMTLILAFLLNSQGNSAVQLTPVEGLVLPQSRTTNGAVEALKLIVTTKGVFVNDKKVADIADGKISIEAIDDKDSLFIKPLYDELDKQAENSRKIASVNETLEFDGKVLLQADSKLNYQVLKQVMYTAASAGFANVKMAAITAGE